MLLGVVLYSTRGEGHASQQRVATQTKSRRPRDDGEHGSCSSYRIERGCSVKVGDLVKRQKGSLGWGRQQLGLVVKIDRDIVKVQWSGDYGTFTHSITSLEAISEAR